MIGKTAKFATTFKPVLEYCYFGVKENGSLDKTTIRGEYLTANKIITPITLDSKISEAMNPDTGEIMEGKRLDIGRIARQFQQVASENTRMEKPSWHQIFSFHKGQEPPREIMEKIVIDFAKEFGMYRNQAIAFIHRDKEHTHIHAVFNRVDLDGVNQSKKYNNYLEVSRFCRKMEEKYNLTPDKPMKAAIVQDTYQEASTSAAERLKVVLDEGISKYDTEKELIQHVEKKGYKVQIGRGISFVDKKTGDTFKGSDLGREYSYKSLQIRLAKTGDEKHEMAANVTAKNLLRVHLLDAITQSNNKAEFIEFLAEKHGIRVEEKPFEKEGKPYTAVTYHFTHQGKDNIIPQSELGKEMSMTNLESNFGKMLPQKDTLRLRVFIADNLDLHENTASLLKAVEENTDYKPVIETYQGADKEKKQRLMFVRKDNPRERINSYDTSRQYTLQGLNTHYNRKEESTFMQTVRDELNLAVPQCTSMEEVSQRLKQKGLILTIIKKEYGRDKVYDRRNFLKISSLNGKLSVEQRYLGKAYSHDALKKQLARNDDEQLRDRILSSVKAEAPGIRTLNELWAKLSKRGITIKERFEPNAAGVQERHLTYSLMDKEGKLRSLDSARFGPLTRNAIQRQLDVQNRDRDKDDLRRTIDKGIERGLQPDQLAKLIKSDLDFDTKTSLRKIGGTTHTILTFSRPGQVKPISNNHLEVQYSSEQILKRCSQANPKGYAQYLQRIEANQLEYPIQINDRGITTKSAITRDLIDLRDQSRSLIEFLDNITRDGKYKWTFLDFNGGPRPELHQDVSGKRPIAGIAFGVEGEAPYYSGISLDKQLSLPGLNQHFAQLNRSLSVSSGGGGDPKAKHSVAPEEAKPRILSTAAQVAASMETQQDKIQADLDRQAAQIDKQERDARGIENRDNKTTNGPQIPNEPPRFRRRLKKKGPRF